MPAAALAPRISPTRYPRPCPILMDGGRRRGHGVGPGWGDPDHELFLQVIASADLPAAHSRGSGNSSSGVPEPLRLAGGGSLPRALGIYGEPIQLLAGHEDYLGSYAYDGDEEHLGYEGYVYDQGDDEDVSAFLHSEAPAEASGSPGEWARYYAEQCQIGQNIFWERAVGAAAPAVGPRRPHAQLFEDFLQSCTAKQDTEPGVPDPGVEAVFAGKAPPVDDPAARAAVVGPALEAAGTAEDTASAEEDEGELMSDVRLVTAGDAPLPKIYDFGCLSVSGFPGDYGGTECVHTHGYMMLVEAAPAVVAATAGEAPPYEDSAAPAAGVGLASGPAARTEVVAAAGEAHGEFMRDSKLLMGRGAPLAKDSDVDCLSAVAVPGGTSNGSAWEDSATDDAGIPEALAPFDVSERPPSDTLEDDDHVDCGLAGTFVAAGCASFAATVRLPTAAVVGDGFEDAASADEDQCELLRHSRFAIEREYDADWSALADAAVEPQLQAACAKERLLSEEALSRGDGVPAAAAATRAWALEDDAVPAAGAKALAPAPHLVGPQPEGPAHAVGVAVLAEAPSKLSRSTGAELPSACPGIGLELARFLWRLGPLVHGIFFFIVALCMVLPAQCRGGALEHLHTADLHACKGVAQLSFRQPFTHEDPSAMDGERSFSRWGVDAGWRAMDWVAAGSRCDLTLGVPPGLGAAGSGAVAVHTHIRSLVCGGLRVCGELDVIASLALVTRCCHTGAPSWVAAGPSDVASALRFVSGHAVVYSSLISLVFGFRSRSEVSRLPAAADGRC